MSQRDVVFVSHANPEDNEFARWLTLKLTALGYYTWSDVTRLLGGEDFWKDIERLIRQRAIKFLFVLSHASNQKGGPLNELHTAQATAKTHGPSDFVIPLRLDNLPHAAINIELGRLNAIDFNPGWAQGLRQLVGKLREDAVPTIKGLGVDTVRHWWEQVTDAEAGVTAEQERHTSNWFPLTLPEGILSHTLTRDTIGRLDPPETLSYPAVWHGLRLISFAPATDLAPALGTQLRISASEPLRTAEFIAGADRSRQREHRDVVIRLVADAWERCLAARGLKAYEMARSRRAFYFDANSLPNENVTFDAVDGRRTFRALRGYRSLKTGQRRHWHFAVSGRPALHPEPMLMVRAHVVFSDNERDAWSSPERMHRARRSQCKDWWNDEWRDRLLAAMSWLAQGKPALELPLSAQSPGIVFSRPVEFISPVRLREPTTEPTPLDTTPDSDEEDDL